jgi:hypothetical protein
VTDTLVEMPIKMIQQVTTKAERSVEREVSTDTQSLSRGKIML